MWRHDAAALVDDCVAFLAGGLAERSGEVPFWHWTNLLAHGTEQDLISAGREERRPTRNPVSPADRWREARSYLAVEVLDLVHEHQPLEEVQRRALAPVEDAVASLRFRYRLEPREWVMVVKSALDDYRRMAQHAARRTVTGQRVRQSQDGC